MPVSEADRARHERRRRQQAGWERFRYMPCTPMGEDGRRITASDKHIELSRQAATEGMVLLKNEGGLLPFASGTKLAVFGKGQVDYVRGGGGSGDVTTSYTRSILQGLQIKESEGKLELFPALSSFYEENVAAQYASGAEIGLTAEPEIPEHLISDAAAFTDTALITICRFSGEGWDRKGIPGDGDFYLTAAEDAMVKSVVANFAHVAVVLNVGGMVDTSWFYDNDRIPSVLLAWQAGIEGGLATADLLCGDATPSGKLTDTFAKSFDDYPSSSTFNESEDYVEYLEDIYVGYRYFETIPGAAARVNYPFGYGLSYTTFAITEQTLSLFHDTVEMSALVTNTGHFSGKEVLQAYYSAPQGKLGKPAKVLAAFHKTAQLAPGESERIVLTFPVTQMASYDDLGAITASSYILEKGNYHFYLGTSVRDVYAFSDTWDLAEDWIVQTLQRRVAPTQLKKRMRSDGTFEELPTAPQEAPHYEPENFLEVPRYAFSVPRQDLHNAFYLADVLEGRISAHDFVQKLPDTVLLELMSGRPNRGVSNTYGFGDIQEYGIPPVMTADGPAGLRILPACKVTATAWPCATMLACSWNPDLVFQVGAAAARELKENGIGIWLAPAMNIHRSPLCGRNFEYYSEDPLISGKIGAAMCNGIQSEKIAACVKHFCCNNKETNRKRSDSRVSERALREIYLKQFEIAVRESQPWTLMTSYNLVNGAYPSTRKDLLQGILREEWGFEGVAMTDWWNEAKQDLEILAGNDVKMPVGYPEAMLKALQEGRITREALERNATRLVELFLRLA